MTRLREKWDGRVTYGGWCTMPGAVSAEIVGGSGYDWVCVDTQHGLIGYDAMVPMLQALTAAGAATFVRVAWNEPSAIMKALDAGAEGVIIPMVNTVDEARAAVAACRYVPHGTRSWGPIRPRLLNPDYSIESAQDIICAVMCETVEGLANLDGMLEVPGVDAVFVGPNDLAVSMGVKNSGYAGENAEHHRAMETIVRKCTERGVVAGIMCGTPETAEHWRQAGFRMLAIESDARMLARAAQADVRRCRELGAAAAPA
ncbi:MAG: aldolase/citrate lyase family protein [Candidatus Dormibacteraeota bacterium]|nr:aldolase/citrate lyase family protein [Candidatus Dormibacteraeota bacterium]